tara:strand:- start:343 stop:957 length:615 start_codon:yes stop_codon:yes gene_type:complete
MLYSIYSLLYSVIRVTKDKSYYLLYGEKEENKDGYIVVERMRKKPLTESIYDHVSAPFISITSIDDIIYLGNAYNAADYYYLKQFGITGIVNACNEISNYFEDDFKYFKIDILDINNSSIYNFFDPFIKFVEKILEEDGKIMIHCFMGSSRSAILVVLYLIKFKSFNIEDSIEFITEKRNRVNINVTYVKELREYLHKNNIDNI